MKQIWKISLWLLVGGIGYLLLATPLWAILGYRLNPSYPKNFEQTVKLNNLKEPVDIYFDDFGIPHIEGKSIEDTIRATGFVHARYRFFQLDMLRRVASGRISALLGDQRALNSSTVEMDRAMRGWGFQQKATVNLESLPELDQKLILAMTDGIQQGMVHYKPIEYDILQLEPEPWTLEDTLLVSLLQAWSITHNWEQEAIRLSLALSLGLDLSDKIYSNDPPLETKSTVRPKQKRFELPKKFPIELNDIFPKTSQVVPQSSEAKKLYSVIGDLMELRPSASNAWVVNGKRSKSGKPIVANDMHLTHTLPSILFLHHLKSPQFDAIGVSLPGLPFVVSGHNGKVVWGTTSAVADVVDLVIEQVDPKQPNKVLNQKSPCALIEKIEKIAIRGEKTREIVMRRTCNGPLLNDMYPKLLPENAPLVSIRWELPEVQNSFGSLLRANKSESLDELRSHLMKVPSPIQNIIGADKKGNIAFFSTGSVPIRRNHRGTFATPGWISKYDWDGFAEISEMPYVSNPEEGYIINTNNQAVNPLAHKPLFQIDSAPSYRYERAEARINSLEKHDVESFQSIQLDNILMRAERVLPYVLKDLQETDQMTPDEKKVIDTLTQWDHSSPSESLPTSLFMALYREAIVLALSDKLPQRSVHMFLKQRYSTVTVDTWFYDESHPVWDNLKTTEREKRQDVVVKAFRKANHFLKSRFGSDLNQWEWGKLHFLQPNHIFGKKSILSFMNLEPTPLAGGLDSVWKAHFNLDDHRNPFKTVAGPAYRMVVDLSDFNEGRFTIDTGLSGWALSPHYGDLYEKWKQGDLVKMYYDWDEIRQKFSHRKMTLTSN